MMNTLEVINLICSILAGLCVCLPLLAKLITMTREAVLAKNWPELLSLVLKYMTLAEDLFATGESKKVWVMKMLNSSANEINYTMTEADWAHVSDMIDKICEMAHTVNTGYDVTADAEPVTEE